MTPATRRRPAAFAVSALLVGALSGCTGGGNASTAAAPSSTNPAGNVAVALQSAFIDTIQKTLPSVVEIVTSNGLGSGVVVDSRGDIVTNDHVVGTSKTFKVGLSNTSTTYSATLVGTFPPDDLAVIRITNPAGLHPATLGDSSALKTGDIVMAMGNPLGLSSSVSEGIVSALGRTVNEPKDAESPGATIPDAIQTSAAINPGNSGGALVNLAGEVIGIPTLAAVDPEIGGGSAAPGIGFAIASNMAKGIANQLISQGKVTNSGRAALGVSTTNVVDAAGKPVGVGITAVVPNGPAARAGLAPADVITKLGSTPITSTQSLADALATHTPGDKVSVTVISPSSNTPRTVTVTLEDIATVPAPT
jgi:putative serine protease PepD